MESYDEQTMAQEFSELTSVQDFLTRTIAPAVKAAIEGHRNTPVYKAPTEQPVADTWAGQPNSAYAQAA